ncbi:MAG: NAD(P)H-dependent oxidoreductase subunit E [Kiritimatiellae bacterium]|jgi:NADH-quinone oxidoreductase subunit E|nr:NAD(P)H-dependent oxidoreductase subunit E [Kiritimatiellia bacterium]MDD3440753.1 NAD(P)H-dependent oxidoreductase subunit E [Kiritimatiellia bacterium]MDD4117645.1 NAD(P)H-dependent oxidoreductase subunit E [Kiritimatiellia bacterium]
MGTKEQVKEPAAADEVLTPELEAFIRKWKNEPGNLIMVLHKVQEHFGYVPRPAAFQVADQLGIPLAKVYGVLTFYHFFKLEKPGRFRISVCMGTACYLKGAADLLQELENILGVGLDTVTPDGLFSVEAVRCLGCCGLAPVMSVNGTMHGNLKREDVAGIVAQYQAKARAE